MKIDRIREVYARSGIDKKYRWRFINEYESRNKLGEAAKSAAYDIIQNFPAVDKGLFLWGNPGTGKTLLSTIILTELITRHAVEGAIKISRGFFQRIRSALQRGSRPTAPAAPSKEFAEADLTVVDDFGTQRDSPREQETLYNWWTRATGGEVHHLLELESHENAFGDRRRADHRGSRRCAAYSRSPVRLPGPAHKMARRLYQPRDEHGRP